MRLRSTSTERSRPVAQLNAVHTSLTINHGVVDLINMLMTMMMMSMIIMTMMTMVVMSKMIMAMLSVQYPR